jgi:hypothetical protein
MKRPLKEELASQPIPGSQSKPVSKILHRIGQLLHYHVVNQFLNHNPSTLSSSRHNHSSVNAVDAKLLF